MLELIADGLIVKKQFNDLSRDNPQGIRCYSAMRNAYLSMCPAGSALSAEGAHQNQSLKNTKYLKKIMLRKLRILRKINQTQAFVSRILCGKAADIPC
jgi:hypothetical protein